MIHKIRENAAFQDVKCHPLKGLALVGDIVLAAGGWSLGCVLKIAQSVSNKKREKDFACLECVIIQSFWAQNPHSQLVKLVTRKI